MPELKNLLQERFCQEIYGGATRAEAYVRAGYKGTDCAPRQLRKNAYKVSTSKWCVARIAELRAKSLDRSKHMVWMNREYILQTTKDHLDRCMQAVPVTNRQGEETGEW